ncbi:PIN domain-containing protein [Spirosoma rigui]|uniref:PIN domain-containing protein n=1 Tax=Spirosoma rigui TaxID=564064 RepID=UPI0009B087DE
MNWVATSSATEDEVHELLSLFQHRIALMNERAVSPGNISHAFRLCSGVDEKDTPFGALALKCNAQLRMRDKELKEG